MNASGNRGSRQRQHVAEGLYNLSRAAEEAALNAFMAVDLALANLIRWHEEHNSEVKELIRFVDQNRTLKTVYFSPEHSGGVWMTALKLIGAILWTGALGYGVINTELSNNLGEGLTEELGWYGAATIGLLLATGLILATVHNAARFREKGNWGYLVMAILSVAVIPLISAGMVITGTYETGSTSQGMLGFGVDSLLMLVAVLGNLALGAVIVHGGPEYKDFLIGAIAKARYRKLDNRRKANREEVHGAQDAYLEADRKLHVAAGELRTVVDRLKAERIPLRLVILNRLRHQFYLDKQVYGADVLGTYNEPNWSNPYDPEKIASMMQRLGDDEPWLDDVVVGDVPPIQEEPPVAATAEAPPPAAPTANGQEQAANGAAQTADTPRDSTHF